MAAYYCYCFDMRAVFEHVPNPLGSSEASVRSHPLSLGRRGGNQHCVADGQSQKKVQVGPGLDARHLTLHLQHQLPVWNHHRFLLEEIRLRLHHAQQDHAVCFHRWKIAQHRTTTKGATSREEAAGPETICTVSVAHV